MSSRIGLVSDVHCSPAPLAEALRWFDQQQVDDIICAGDIAGYYEPLNETVALLESAGCRSIVGNHDQYFLERESDPMQAQARNYLATLPETLSLEIEDIKVFVVHANPPSEQHGGIKLLDQDGEVKPERIDLWRQNLAGFDHDVLIVGHTHQVYAERIGDTLVVNPGSSAFNHSCMILKLPEMTVETRALGSRDLIKCWRFSMLRENT